MSDENKTAVVADDLVITIEYTLTVDGEVLDSSKEEGPLDFLQGHKNIIPGLEMPLAGMKVGEEKEVVVAPADGYGEYEDDALIEVPKDEFPEGIPLDVGIELQLTDNEGGEAFATIAEIGEDVVTLDANHPLAGEELHFWVKVTGIRTASQEEIDHGHVHFEGHDHE